MKDGFKIFVYHSSVKNILPKDLIHDRGNGYRMFPKNFDYYAGGIYIKGYVKINWKDIISSLILDHYSEAPQRPGDKR